MMRVLIADDNQFYRQLLTMTLKEWGYAVEAVADGDQAWEKLRAADAPPIALLDWMMPGMDGPTVCRKVRELARPEPTYLMVLTSKAGKENIVKALDAGADDYLTKPFDREELHARIRVGARVVGLQTSQAVIFAFARAVEAKNPYTQGHADRVTHYASALAERLGIKGAEATTLRRGALVHDIGKIAIPDALLDKPGRLTGEEFEIVKRHPVDGYKMIQNLQSCEDLLPLVRWHHERLDGCGYPDGLSGEAIPHLVRILSVADVFDALASKRPYRPALPMEVCLDEMRKNAEGGGLDRSLVEAFATHGSEIFAGACEFAKLRDGRNDALPTTNVNLRDVVGAAGMPLTLVGANDSLR